MQDILIQPLAASQWRVIDTRLPETDACSLLGFIEEKSEQFEVMQLRHGFEWFILSSLAEAVHHFSASGDGPGTSELDTERVRPETQDICAPAILNR
ncbi:hypothetical protein B7R25_04590 [Subtercola boreus]|uniref:Uncharacterized protein n=2 Tax=Subtercola boreus TaxID=120213 RepID=A0A3E0WEG7_9MICO|nr:hypothetical protein B7R24_04580 [Subtercola boreus]RFA22359.1 hypothetical protein B7R23_04575 [Subtercola boreus]RFA28331.1 hypothetical protein B7R25_04590 [Subtercola boreus]